MRQGQFGNLEPVRYVGARTTPSNERKALSSIIRNADDDAG